MKIILADDATLIREGLAGLLERLGHQVIAQAEDAPGLIAAVKQAGQAGQLPDVLVTDVRMPPGMSDDGLRAAVKIREEYPDLGIMVLSQYVAPAYAAQLFSA
ncbi:response regulator transcription factor, partial [uncultured Varibaculum sp.]